MAQFAHFKVSNSNLKIPEKIFVTTQPKEYLNNNSVNIG